MKNNIVSHQASPTQHLHGEEVCVGQDVHVSGNEILPRSRLASLWNRSNAVASQNVSHRLIGQAVTQIGQRSDDAIISPASILTRHSHHQSFHVRFNGGAAWIRSVFGTIELLGDEPSIPGQDGVGLCDAGDLSERLASHTPPDLGEGGALGITQPQSRWQLSPSEYGSPRPGIHSAGEAPDSPIPSPTLAVATTSCSSCRLLILLWPPVV